MADTVKLPGTALAVKNYMDMTTKEMQSEWKGCETQDRADYSNMLKDVGIQTKDNETLNAKAAAKAATAS